MSHLGPTTSAPRASTRCRRARSADTSVTWVAASAVVATSVSSPLPSAWTTVTPPATPSSTPPRAAPSRTTTTGSVSRPDSTAARTRSTNARAAPGRSRHQPVGRDPTTFAASMRSTAPVSPPRRAGARHRDLVVLPQCDVTDSTGELEPLSTLRSRNRLMPAILMKPRSWTLNVRFSRGRLASVVRISGEVTR